MRFLAGISSFGGLLGVSGALRKRAGLGDNVSWLRHPGSTDLASRMRLASGNSRLLLLLTVGALLVQAFGFYYEINRRTIQDTAGIRAMGFDLSVKTAADSQAAQMIGLQDGDQIVRVNGRPVANVIEYREVLNHVKVGGALVLTVLRDGQAITLPPVVVQRLPPDPTVLLRQIVGLAFLLVGGAVVMFGPQRRATRLFSFASLLMGLYVGLLHSHASGLIYLQGAALAFAPAAIVHFFFSFPRERPWARSRWIALLYVPSLVLLVLIVVAYNDALQKGMGSYHAPLFTQLTDRVGFAYLGLSGALGLAVMGHAYATASQPIQRRRLQWILLGLSFALVAAITDLILTWSQLHSPQTSFWLLLGFLPVPVAFAFAILRYRLWDLDLVINRSMVYSMVTASLVAVYLLVVGGLSMALGIAAGSRGYTAVLFLSALLIGLLFNPLRTRIQSAIDRIFFRQQVDHQAALARWSEELSTSLRFADVARLLLVEVPQQLQIESAWLLVLDQDEDCLVPLDLDGEGDGEKQNAPAAAQRLTTPVCDALALDLNRPGTVLLLPSSWEHPAWSRGPGGTWVHPSSTGALPPPPRGAAPGGTSAGEAGRDVVGGRDLIGEWKEAGVRLALPLVSGGQGAPLSVRHARPGLESTGLVGIYLLGLRLSGDVYQRQEMELMRTLANQAAIAIANARLYERVTGFSQELEIEVQDRTKELRDFVSVVYHELSTPITSIRGFTDVLLEREAEHLNDRQRRYLVTIRRNVGRLMRLVGDLSDVSKIDGGRLTIHPELLDLRQVVSETVASLEGIVEDKGLQVTISVPPDAATVEGDRHRVMQILNNLLTNACRYTPAGGQITIAARQHSSAPRVEVTVTDTGIGIHKGDLEHIFERFYRSEDPLVQEQSGTGLGLPITQSLVELHGSSLWVKSTVGQGSTFGFSLPLVEEYVLLEDAHVG
ncbi:MAG: ATP-binding protein [Anaerolineae bacterium]